MGSRKHRLIWESNFGSIPKDESGRSYEIHHIDGNHSNNNIENLMLVTIQEHYDIHYQQQDWNACKLIALRMNKSVEEISDLSRKAAQKRIQDGTHHFIELNKRDRSDMRGKFNPMKNPEVVQKNRESRIQNNKEYSEESRKKCSLSAKKYKKYTCLYCDKSMNRINLDKWHNDNCKLNPNRIQKDRKTNFSILNPAVIKITCQYCQANVGIPNFYRWHNNNCKGKK